jgi:hypothetical protein
VNRHGTLANLVAAHPGNANAVRYGVHSPDFIRKLAVDIEEELFGACQLSPVQRVATHEVARCLAMLQRIDLDLDERGIVDRKGQPRYLLALRVRVTREMERWAQHLTAVSSAPPESRGAEAMVGELTRIGMGHDSTASARDRIEALKEAIERSGPSWSPTFS